MEKIVELTLNGEVGIETFSLETAKDKAISYGVSYVLLKHNKSILLQRRGKNVESQAGLIDFSAGGHVSKQDTDSTRDADNVFREAAIRETFEELGLKLNMGNVKLLTTFFEEKVSKAGEKYRKHYRVFVYELEFPLDLPLKSSADVDYIKWISIQELAKLPETFSFR